jgi:hypothetical protein
MVAVLSFKHRATPIVTPRHSAGALAAGYILQLVATLWEADSDTNKEGPSGTLKLLVLSGPSSIGPIQPRWRLAYMLSLGVRWAYFSLGDYLTISSESLGPVLALLLGTCVRKHELLPSPLRNA